jgi:hypothetical protein
MSETAVEVHHQAEKLMGLGDLDRTDNAFVMYLQASSLEAKAYKLTTPEQVQSRNILAVSATALAYKGGDYGQGIQFAKFYLKELGIDKEYREQLQEFLRLMEKAMERGSQDLSGKTL